MTDDTTTPEKATGDAQDGPEGFAPSQDTPDRSEAVTDAHRDDDGGTFTRDYVAGLRDEAKTHRLRAREAEGEAERLRAALWQARVSALDVLVDPADLPLDLDALDDPDAIAEQARALVAARPHLAKRRARGNIGQHEHGATGDTGGLLDAMRGAIGLTT